MVNFVVSSVGKTTNNMGYPQQISIFILLVNVFHRFRFMPPRRRNGRRFNRPYFTFFPAIDSAGFPACEFAVAKTFGFSCFGFLVSFLLFLPLVIVCPLNMHRSGAGMARIRLLSFTDHLFKARGGV